MNKHIARTAKVVVKAAIAAYVATAVIVVCAASIHAAVVTIPAYPAPPTMQQPGKGHHPAAEPAELEPAAEVDKPCYAITDAERSLIEQIVMAEAGNQGLHGQMLVAQCILTACLEDDIRPAEAIERYKYTKPHPEPTDSVSEAVTAVFDAGELPSAEPIKYFYSTRYCESDWHEKQIFVLGHRDHKFFAERRIDHE